MIRNFGAVTGVTQQPTGVDIGLSVGSVPDGVQIPNGTSLSSLYLTAIGSDGSYYCVDVSTTYYVGRIFDKNWNLIQTVSVANFHVWHFSPDGYTRKIDSNNVEIRKLDGTVIGTVGVMYVGVNIGTLRLVGGNYQVTVFNTSSGYAVNIYTQTGSQVFSYGVSGASNLWLNKKGNFIVNVTVASSPQYVYMIDKTLTQKGLMSIIQAYFGFDLRNW